MVETYVMRCRTPVTVVSTSAQEIAADLPHGHVPLYGLSWTLEADGSRSFAAYVGGSLAAYSVNRDEGRILRHGLVEKLGGPRGLGRLVFAHDGLVVSGEGERDVWIVDAAHPSIDSALRQAGYGSSGLSGPNTWRYEIDLTNSKKRKTLRKRMRTLLSQYTVAL